MSPLRGWFQGWFLSHGLRRGLHPCAATRLECYLDGLVRTGSMSTGAGSGVGGNGERQGKKEGGAVAERAFHADATTVGEHDVLGNRQAQAGAA